MKIINVDTLLEAQQWPIIDVRSPGEFAHGHIRNANNIPLFDDSERAEIGTLYKQTGRQPAVERGLEIAGAKAERLIESVRAITGELPFAVHCWRGGMRSEGFAWLCQDCGLKPRVLGGGYKSFRRAAHQSFADLRRIVVLAGHTGAGKTKLLSALRSQGHQVIDLEGLANHRGSAFGGIGQPPQPTGEQFENELFLQWRRLDPTRVVWIEGESRAICKVKIPQAVWDQMSSAPMIFVEVEKDRRVDFLVQEYGDFPADQLSLAIEKISKRLGGARMQSALDALQRGDVRAIAADVLDYYDKSYARALSKRPSEKVVRVPLTISGQVEAASRLIQLGTELTKNIQIAKQATVQPTAEVFQQAPSSEFSFRI